MKPEIVLLCIVIITFITFIFTNAYPPQPNCEGFDGDVPSSPQTSMIPHDVSAATTNDPKISLPQPIDIRALMEVIRNFQLLYNAQNPNTLDIDEKSLKQVEYFMKQSDNLLNQLQAALADSNAAHMSLEDLTDIRRAYMCTMDILRNKSDSNGPSASPIGTDPNTLTLDTLIKLQDRVKGESLRLANLRSSSADIITRINDLDNLSSNLGDIITNIQRKTMKITDVNITPTDADKFLSALGSSSTSSPLPPLALPSSTANTPLAAFAGNASTPMSNIAQGLMEKARTMKWSVAVAFENDPTIEQNQMILDKLTAMENSLQKYMVSGTPIPPDVRNFYTNQMNTLQGMVRIHNTDVPVAIRGMHNINQASPNISYAEVPTPDQMAAIQGAGGMTNDDSDAVDSMNAPSNGLLDQILHRGSVASFDTSKVGGLDYKSRVLDMCQQIQSSGLGDAKNFGCIQNPNNVSASYSWKGNYQMVCSRLADTWGAWYPQMFGCPKVDPTAKF